MTDQGEDRVWPAGFPITDFGADGEFDAASYARRLQWLSSYGAAGLFAAGGTGEFFSIGYDEYDAVISTAVENSAADVPVLAGVGYGTLRPSISRDEAASARRLPR